MDPILQKIKEFHGHLGPYATIGYRMGLAANREFGDSAFKKVALAYCGTNPPLSCMIDGIQLSSGCTMGKGNITVVEQGEARVRFTAKDGTRAIEIVLRSEIQEMITESMTSWESGDMLAEKVFSMSEEKLLEIRNL